MNEINNLKPMPLWQSLLFFCIPTGIFCFSIYIIMSYLGGARVNPIINYSLTLMGPVILLFVASLVVIKLEGYLLDWNTIKKRFRLKPMRKTEWIWALGLSVFMALGNVLLLPTQKWLITILNFKFPDFLPSSLDPRVVVNGIPPEFTSTSLLALVVFQLLFLFFNIFGEEFWWRGYVLPRQELTHGKYTWIIHGILWTLFHIFWWWNLLLLLPGALAASYVAQKLKNTTVIIVAHLAVNTMGGTVLMLLSS